MKIKALSLVLAVILLIIPLSSCQKDGEYTAYGFYDPNTEIEYHDVPPFGLYAVNAGEEYIKVGEGETAVTYREVYFQDPNEFLCVEDSGELLLVYNKDIECPTLETFNPIAANIMSEDNKTLVTNFYADEKYLPEDQKNGVVGDRDSELCKSFVTAIVEGDAVELPSFTPVDMFYVRLLSKDYPGLYYSVVFFGNGTGRYFLRDRASGKTVYCTAEIIARMVG